jgi:hypothetical protein
MLWTSRLGIVEAQRRHTRQVTKVELQLTAVLTPQA